MQHLLYSADLLSQKFVKLSTRLGILGFTVTPHVLSVDEDIWERLLTCHFQKGIPDVVSFIHFVQFVHFEIHALVRKEGLRLRAEGAVRLGKDNNLVAFDFRFRKVHGTEGARHHADPEGTSLARRGRRLHRR